jgi:hypothetical protein
VNHVLSRRRNLGDINNNNNNNNNTNNNNNNNNNHNNLGEFKWSAGVWGVGNSESPDP